ncbi:MAG: hypothetical protein IPM57_12565 [Oligoflexia bacterium]|nr:hypothetical protein [Oligoflexia bacterium]
MQLLIVEAVIALHDSGVGKDGRLHIADGLAGFHVAPLSKEIAQVIFEQEIIGGIIAPVVPTGGYTAVFVYAEGGSIGRWWWRHH